MESHPFVFISDLDKGLKPALRRVFPGNLAVRCAKHIQANVKAKFGQLCHSTCKNVFYQNIR
jgi:hypothetical protein